MLIIRNGDVRQVLNGSETETIDVVRDSYRLHDENRTAVPHSIFLRFPDSPRDRIIGLPAYRGGDEPVAGMKWIASFPKNIESGIERASATVLLNSMETGRPVAMVEGSVISARRTAASAALAATLMVGAAPAGVTLVGCGVINFEVLRFLTVAFPGLNRVTVFDMDPARAGEFVARCAELLPDGAFEVADTLDSAMGAHDLVSLATTAAEPYTDLSHCRPGSVVLNVSLRDLTPESVLAAQNVVDDPDHVCREKTSLHLAQELAGDRRFIDATIGQLIRGTVSLERDPDKVRVFSPFGLGVLDIALAEFVRTRAESAGLGLKVEDFLPGPATPADR
ncbi:MULTISPECIES: 2,3-diaminopropionate biosynthesis protein SbnB [Streptomyces]|uniref:2,3-diaminopropionate biosynthesis protein SbnB n=1 Tax=Streptomyces ehimensis TaxID=68195 RepID=A0ABV9BMH9_9ACTN